MTPETIGKLEDGFLMGFTDREARLYAAINPSTLYEFCKANPDFSERKELLKENVKMIAKSNIAKEIKAGDKLLSQWYTQARDPDFKPKQEIDNKGQVTINIIRFEDSNSPSQLPTENLPTPTSQGA